MARGQLDKYLSVEFRREMRAGEGGLSVSRWIQSPKRRGTRAEPQAPASKCGEMTGSSKDTGKGMKFLQDTKETRFRKGRKEIGERRDSTRAGFKGKCFANFQSRGEEKSSS